MFEVIQTFVFYRGVQKGLNGFFIFKISPLIPKANEHGLHQILDCFSIRNKPVPESTERMEKGIKMSFKSGPVHQDFKVPK